MFDTVEADVYLMADGDDTYPATSAQALLEVFRARHADMVVGVRLTEHHSAAFRPLHTFGNHLVAWMISTLFGTPVSDVLSGYRVFSRRFVRRVPLSEGGFGIETEMTLQALAKNFVLVETPIPYGSRPEGSFSKLNTFSDGYVVLMALVGTPAGAGPVSGYAGADNLEAMRAARRYNQFLVDTILAERGTAERALDFGAGLGTFAAAVRDAGLAVRCVEPDASLRAHIEQAGLTSVSSLDEVGDASVAYAYTLNVLEHIADDRAAVRDLARVLVPGGRLLVYVPAFQVLYSEMDRVVGHHRRYRRAELVELVERAGLRIVRARYVDSVGFAAALAYRAIGGGGQLDPSAVARYDRWIFPVSRLVDRVVPRVPGKNLLVVAEKPLMRVGATPG